jgi:predicted DNA-binding transcriptional regulator YafY
MSQLERLYRIEQMLLNAPAVSFDRMQETLEISRATLKRDLAYLRDRLHAPIEYDRLAGGYKMATDRHDLRHQLPGLWFSPQEIRALLTMHHLLRELDSGGLLAPHVQPLLDRIKSLMGSGQADAEHVTARVKLISASQHRHTDPVSFEAVGNALMMRKRLRFRYLGRHRNEVSQREVSPQRLSYYRENWYLDAWCHGKQALRKFALDAMREPVMSEEAAHELQLDEVNRQLAQGYGVYFGGQTQTARLRFSAAAARWIRHEQWHPQQITCELDDGALELSLPYSQPTELVMDILRHGENVEVLEPPALRQAVADRVQAMQSLYSQQSRCSRLTP